MDLRGVSIPEWEIEKNWNVAALEGQWVLYLSHVLNIHLSFCYVHSAGKITHIDYSSYIHVYHICKLTTSVIN
jgi:hypothetical protein